MISHLEAVSKLEGFKLVKDKTGTLRMIVHIDIYIYNYNYIYNYIPSAQCVRGDLL